MTVALYARVSTAEQSVETQLRALYAYVEARGWKIFREYTDVGYTGASAARPDLDALMRDAAACRFKVVLVWKFDRLFRSVAHMVEALQHFHALGIDFISLTESIDTTTPAGKMVFTMLAAVAEFERDLIRERTQAGMARARAAGRRIGRPSVALDVPRARELLKDHSYRQAAKLLRVSVGKLHAAIVQPVHLG